MAAVLVLILSLLSVGHAFVHPFPPDPPKQVSAQEHCEICRAVMEQVPLKLGNKKWNNVNVVDAMENICNGEVRRGATLSAAQLLPICLVL